MKTVVLGGAKAAGRVTRVDDDDYEKVEPYRWHVMEETRRPGGRPRGPYARTHIRLPDGRRTTITMHRLLMPGVAKIDHEDGDGLNNQRSTNLRSATDAQNQHNRAKQGKPAASRFKGVSWDKNRRKWAAQVNVNRRKRNLGRFTDEVDAARAYDTAAREVFGAFARPNFPEDS